MVRRCDVVIAGAGIAGCTAAILYARAGLRVILLEAHRDIGTFKRACTHLIQSSAVPTIRRLGLDGRIETAGGIRNETEFYTAAGWVRAPETADAGFGYNLRRSELDPLLRRAAMETEGVEVMLGTRVRELTYTGKRVTGVVARGPSGEPVTVRARLVVGAEGRHSAVATMSGVPTIRGAHRRFGFFAHYAHVRDHRGADYVKYDDGPARATSRLWLLDPDVAYLLPNDNRVVLAAMVAEHRRAEYLDDLDGGLRSIFGALPDGPDLSDAKLVSKVTPVKKYESVSRFPAAPGLALIGDAAMVTDYLWGAGCGWAFQGAEWLVDATAKTLRSGGNLTPALWKYAIRHGSRLGAHQMFNANFATGRRLNKVERLVFGAATDDEFIAERVAAFGSRQITPVRAFTPGLLVRAWRSCRAMGGA